MRIITVILLLAYSSLSVAENDSDQYFCNINALKNIDYSADMAGYYQDDYDAIFPKWLAKAKSGDKKYQFYIAKTYQYGQGVAQNKKSALEWYTKSSDQGYAVAKNNLAFFYSDGEILDIDLDKHFSLLCDAASRGLSLATLNIAFLYLNLVDANDRRVFEWMLKASLQGDANAQNELGLLYYNGSGGALQSKSKALEWIQKSANQGYALAESNLGWMYQNGEGIPQNYNKAFEWYQKSAGQGYDVAQGNLAYLYLNGLGVIANLDKAFEWFEKSSIQGNLYAKGNLAWLYQEGLGTPQDYNKAYNLYQLPAESGDPLAQNNLGLLYATGKGVPQNYEKAFSWYKKSANQGDPTAQLNLGDFYENGKGVPQNYDEAFNWYKKSAEQGLDSAQYNLGLLYYKGLGVTKDYNQSIAWNTKSAEQGNQFAMQSLGLIYLYDLNDSDMAFSWFELGVKSGNNESAFSLGLAYSDKERSYYDIQLAIKYLEIAYELNHKDAAALLGVFYNWGSKLGYPGLKVNIKKAEYWYLNSATDYDDAISQSNLANIYSQPNEWPEIQDEKKSFYWAQRSADQGNLLGMSILANHYEWGRGGAIQNGERAINIYKDIINKGDLSYSITALRDIGHIYANGWTEINRDFKEAIKYFLRAEALGDKESQSLLGKLYVGLGDYKNAKKWFEKSGTEDSLSTILTIDLALKGDAEAEYDLAFMISSFDNRNEVNELYESAALKGSIKAQAELGVNYKQGIGVEANQQVSIFWLKKAAEQGDATAQNNLGVLYHNGTGVNKDIDQALYWYTLAAEQNYPLSFRNLGSIYLTELNDAEKAIEYYQLAIEYQDYSAAWDLAYLYKKGRAGIKVNEKLAFKWMLFGANKSNKLAQFELSLMYLNGFGTKIDKVESTKWLINAFNSRVYEGDPEWVHEEIIQELAFRYYWGIGVERSLEKAKEYDFDYAVSTLSQSAKSSSDLNSIADMYRFEGNDIENSILWYQKAADKGHIYAQRTLGGLYSAYAQASGITPDYSKAELLFLKAIDQGDIESMVLLAQMYYAENERPGVPNDKYNPSKSFDLLIKAKEAGSESYHMGLVTLYRFGLGVEKDVSKALAVVEDKLMGIKDFEEEYWLWSLWSIHVENNISDDDAFSRTMTYFIDQSKLGDVGATNTLASMYLNKDFKYYDEKEAMYWLNKVKDSSFHANTTLSNYTDNFSKYGDYLLTAIELYETGKAEDFVSEETLINTYFIAAGYFRDVNAPERVEALLRKMSLMIPENEENPYRIMLNVTLAGINHNNDPGTELFLNNEIKMNDGVIAGDLAALQNKFYALLNLHEIYLDKKETKKALNIALRALKVIDLFGSAEDFLDQRIILLTNITKDYVQIEDFSKANQYFEDLDYYINVKFSNKYIKEHARNTTINDSVTLMWRDIIRAVIIMNNGETDEGFKELNATLEQVKSLDIPLRRHDLDFALIPLDYLTKNSDYDKAGILMSKVIDLYQQGVENRIRYNSKVSAQEKNKIRDAISEYIYISSLAETPLADSGFKVMQLASGLTLSDTVIKSISTRELRGTLLIKSKLLETLNKERSGLIDEKFKTLSSGSEKIQALDIKLNDLDQEINSLEDDLEGSLGESLDKFIISSDVVKENISKGDGLLTMLFSDKRSYVWLTTKEGVFRHDSDMTSSEISLHAKSLLSSLDPSQLGNIAFPVQSSSRLYDLLIEPFKEKLKGVDRLIFAPDPILSQIPFSILTKSGTKGFDVVANTDDLRGVASVKIKPSGKPSNDNLENVEWLIEDFAIAIIPSVYSYVGLEGSNEEKFDGITSFLGIGNPTLSGSEVIFKSDVNIAMNDQRGSISRTLRDLSALPETETELNTIANYFSSSEIITQGDATEAKIRDMDLSGIDVIAFATHALVSNEIDDLFEPAIVLTPVDSNNPGNDGLLMASEVAELNMDADIVLLSACNTASSFDESNSQGLSGLADSFFAAGAKSILASYWSVISDSAVDITTKMFDKSNTGRSYSHKHRESVLKILAEPNSYKSNPVYWAPFMVVGIN